MSDTPYVPFYTSDFLAGTSGMTSSTKGVYITLICLMYEAEGPIPQKWDTLARRCGCTLPAFKRAVSDLQDDGKIEVTDTGIWSDKCNKHITQRRERSSSARAAANKRWEKTEQKQGKSDASAYDPQCQPEPEPYISKRDTKVSHKNKPEPVSSKPKKRACQIPENAVISEKMIEYAETRGHDLVEAEAQFDKFKNNALANGRTYVNWDRAFLTWLDSAYFKPITKGGFSHGKSTNNRGDDALDAIFAAARSR
jgi:uncharacterized protein YdaU (DUF1376 family)